MTETPNLTDISSYNTFEPVSLRYSDEDSMGHVNNVAYAAFFESGRMGLFTHLLADLGDQKFNFVLAHVSIDYRQEMRFPGTVQVGGRLLKVGTKSITTGYGAFLNGTCHATSLSVNVYFDPKTRASRPFPDDFRAALQSQLAG